MSEDEAIVQKASPKDDRLDGTALYPDLLQHGTQQNAVIVYRQLDKRPGIMNLPEFPSSRVLAHDISFLEIAAGLFALSPPFD
jgi:hypothetical protein